MVNGFIGATEDVLRLSEARLFQVTTRLTPVEARRAVYIDFEGRTDKPPVLLGALYATGDNFDSRQPVLIHYVVDPSFAGLGGDWSVSSMRRYEIRHASLGQALNEVIRLARSRDRLIVSWSQFDMQKVMEHGLTGMLADEFALRYRDAKATAKRWFREHHGDVHLEPGRSGRLHSLENYAKLIGFEIPEKYGVGRTGENLRVVGQALERHSVWNDLTDRQQGRWLEVVGHNAYDLLGLRDVTERSAAELSDG